MQSKLLPLIAMLSLVGLQAGSPAVAAEPGAYIGAAFGQSQAADLDSGRINASLASIGLGAATSVDDKGSPFKLFGGFRFSENLAVEGGYTSFGKFTSNSTIVSGGSGTLSGEWSGYSLDIAAVGMLPVGQSLTVFGKAGLGLWDLELDLTASGPGGSLTANDSDSGISPIVGLGAMFNVSSNFAIRADWERHLAVGDDNTTGESDIDLITIGAQFSF